MSKDSYVTAQNAHSFPPNRKNLWGGRLGPFDKYAVSINLLKQILHKFIRFRFNGALLTA